MTKSWKHQEKRVAKEQGGTRNAGSGAFDRKGDIRTPGMLWELKWTGKKSKTITSTELEKIVGEALAEDRLPVFGLELNGRNYVVLEEDDFVAIYTEAGAE